MITFLVGTDTKKKYAYMDTLTKGRECIVLPQESTSKELLLSYASGVSLFGESPVVSLQSMIGENIFELSKEEWMVLSESHTLFFFSEDTLLKADEKRLMKYGSIERFEHIKVSTKQTFNPFALADYYARRDKMNAWITYTSLIDNGDEPEKICGMLFWKIKTMIQNGTTVFSKEELYHQSSQLVALYHRAHRGEVDFTLGLEQFIVQTLSK